MANHKITNIDVELRLGDCSECGPNLPIRPNLKSNGVQYWRCLAKYTAVKNAIERPYVAYKKDYCEWEGGCDFQLSHPCQLGVDHIDGNRSNNDPENLQTLCHNHHALKTMWSGDHKRRKVKAI